ncbi:hypothetical protein DRI50_02375, partial [candidate division KSB1 bacterium]
QKERQQIVAKTSPAQRKKKLTKLYRWIREHQQDIRQALTDDLHKPAQETDLTEIFIALAEIKHIIKHLPRWMKPRKVRKTLTFLTTTAWLRYEPRGVVLIISPWNFPFHLSIVPLAAAKHLTPVTLELGGKSPVVVDKSARLADAARKIAFGKYLNSGQTCIA